jgi:hypothetical protein
VHSRGLLRSHTPVFTSPYITQISEQSLSTLINLKPPYRNRKINIASICQSTAGLTSTCLQREVKYHPVSLEMTCGQHVQSLSRYYHSIWVYHKISVATKVVYDALLAPIPYTGQKFLSHRRSKQRRFPKYEFKAWQMARTYTNSG